MRLLPSSWKYLCFVIVFIFLSLHIFSQAVAQSSGLSMIVGPNKDPNPVVNEGGQINLNVLDNNGYPVTDNVTFESDNPDVATVDSTGKVNGRQRGFATITARRNRVGV